MSIRVPYGGGHTPSNLGPPTGFEVVMDVKGIPPEEISVNIAQNAIYVDVDYMQRLPGWPVKYLKRQIHRRFEIPPGFDSANVVSGLTPEGNLSIRCAASHIMPNQRQLPIGNHSIGYRGEF